MTSMTLDEFRAAMGFDDSAAAILAPIWEDAVASLPERIDFLEPEFLDRWAPAIGDSGILTDLQRVAERVRRDPALRLYAWALHRGHLGTPLLDRIARLPAPERQLGPKAGLFTLLVYLAVYPAIAAKHRELDLPQQYTDALLTWPKGRIQEYREFHDGVPGIGHGTYQWFRNYIDGKVFRVGRLEYMLHSAPPWLPAIYRRKADGKLAVFARDGWCFDAAGERAETGFRAELRRENGTITGTPIAPEGKALVDRRLTIDLDEFEAVADPWELLPSCHIPSGGGLTPEAVLDSLRRAREFFRRYFHQEVRLFCCRSWLLNPDWERELPDSNIAAFQRIGYLAPGDPPDGVCGLVFVFTTPTVDYDRIPQKTALHRAFKHLHDIGRPLRSGTMFLFADDLDRLAPGYYRDPEKYLC